MSEIADDYITLMRGMYAEARIRFREMVEPHISTEGERAQAERLMSVIGEASPEEVLAAFLRDKVTGQSKGWG